MQIIAFGYKKRTGKDTSGKFLDSFLRCERPGLKIKKISFASKLKDVCYQLWGWAGLQPGVYYETEAGQKVKEVILPRIGKSPRQIWIEVGNKMREVHEDVWIDFALNGVSGDVIIITDLRFRNEAMKVKEKNGTLVKLVREGLPSGADPAEIDLDEWGNWDFVVLNNGDLEDLHGKIEEFGRRVLNG